MKRLQLILSLVVVAIIVAVAVVLIFFRGALFGSPYTDKGEGLSPYSAVFVNGGNVYFGKIVGMDSEKFVLEEVFIYGVVPEEEQGTSGNNQQQRVRQILSVADRDGIALAERYYINRSQVLSWFTMKDDSGVVRTIEDYKKNPNAIPTATPAASPTPAGR